MKLVYVLSMAHSGSTLSDCILGTHPDFISSGELRYLNWQLYRTINKRGTVENQDICSCKNDFRDCEFWSVVLERIHKKTGIDLVKDPISFDTSYFNQFAYKDRGGFSRSSFDRIKAFITREWVEQGRFFKLLPWANELEKWLSNNWMLYETMAEVSSKPIVVDSSKHLMIALLLQQYKPNDVTFLFLHRSMEALVASARRWGHKKGKGVDIDAVIVEKQRFEKRILKYKKKVNKLNYLDADYEEMVGKPAGFLENIVSQLEASPVFDKQTNDSFYINPEQLHIVAGNPMRYKGKQKVQNDVRWKQELSEDDTLKIRQAKSK